MKKAITTLAILLALFAIGSINPQQTSAVNGTCGPNPSNPSGQCLCTCPDPAMTVVTGCAALGPGACAGVSCQCESAPPGGTGDYFKPEECDCDPDWRPEFCVDYPPLRTAVGCIPTHPLLFVAQFRDILIGVGGGIAFLLLIIGAFFVLTSQGDPERVKRGKEIFVGALVGLLIMIFSVFILQLTFTDILDLFK